MAVSSAVAKAAAPACRVTKYDKAILKLEKQLAKLGSCPKIANPCMVTGPSGHDREEWQQWRNQKALRGKVGALASANLSARELYAALRALGLSHLRTFSDLHTDEKRSLYAGERDSRYLRREEGNYMNFTDPKNLWKFQPGLNNYHCSYRHSASRPSIYGDPWDAPDRWGAHRYESVLEWSRARRELLSQIEATRIMAIDAAARKSASSETVTDQGRELLAA
jgi:hypothetical protein